MARPFRRGLRRSRHNHASALLGLGAMLLTLVLLPQDAKAWWNDDWTYREKLTIDAGPKGAALAEDPGRMPVLLRLHDGNFKFLEAKDDGSDLRVIAGDDKTPLKFHIESYDSVLGIGFLWIDVPAIKASAPTELWLYWGNPKASAPTADDAAATYDGDTALVYHFGEHAAPPHDTTANHNNGQGTPIAIPNSQIGGGVRFDGATAVVIPTSPSLGIAQAGGFTWSAWIKPADPAANAVIFAKSDNGKSLAIGLDQNVPYVEVNDGTAAQRSGAVPALAPGSWHHLAVTADDHIALYVDGKPAASLAVALPALAGPSSLGAAVDPNNNNAVTSTGYNGELDELEIAKTARKPGFIAAAFASQSADSKFTGLGQEEQHASWFSGGYFGVILKSVTTDGWVVIGFLAIMAVISWIVMITKTRYVNRTAKANRLFLDVFTRVSGDMDRFKAEAAKGSRQITRACLFRIYRGAADELNRRFQANDDPSAPRVLGPEAIATIRAILDRIASEESQRLNRSIVLLTIAISGGPFLGLLGTVVGVMITFAAIAASGDVNITAIAPGMAAALVATTAGLGVAIPALFGYNYLISRIKDVTTDMHVFVDELATRLAETYHARPNTENLAAE